MIQKTADAIAGWLLQKGAISEEDCELYAYSAFSLILGIAPVLITVLLGLLTGMLKEGLLMIAPFIIIRKFSGGYHLKSTVTCIITSTGIIGLGLLIIWLSVRNTWYMPIGILSLLAAVSICIFSPIDSEDRRLSEKEKNVFGLIARIMILTAIGLCTALMLFNLMNAAVSIETGICIVALLQIPAVIKQRVNRLESKE